MLPNDITQQCVDNGGSANPELNDTLPLSFSGYTKIENLGPYTKARGLFLQSNRLTRIENIEHMSMLRCLNLAKNAITQISGLTNHVNLVMLDLTQNSITTITGLQGLPNLATLLLAKNQLVSGSDCEGLKVCPSITKLDLSHNMLTDLAVLSLLAPNNMPRLTGLMLEGNPMVQGTRHFRKRALAAMGGGMDAVAVRDRVRENHPGGRHDAGTPAAGLKYLDGQIHTEEW
jgi:dynein assembly factor 1